MREICNFAAFGLKQPGNPRPQIAQSLKCQMTKCGAGGQVKVMGEILERREV